MVWFVNKMLYIRIVLTGFSHCIQQTMKYVLWSRTKTTPRWIRDACYVIF